MSLYLTPTRRALLMAVDRGEVHRYGDGVDYCNGWKKCSAAMELMRDAGWVRLTNALNTDTWSGYKIPWELCDAGKAVLGEVS